MPTEGHDRAPFEHGIISMFFVFSAFAQYDSCAESSTVHNIHFGSPDVAITVD